MAASQLDLIMNQVQQLSANEQLQIIKRIAALLERPVPAPVANGNSVAEQNAQQTPDSVSESARQASLRDVTADRQWLAEHCDEYAGQWVALKHGQLISHGKDHLAVYRAAKAAGHPDALLELVEPSDALPFIF